jgi:two-component system sensor histidine kinase ChvG
MTGSRLRRLLSRLSVRLVATHLLLVTVPIAGFFAIGLRQYLGLYERQLLDAQEVAMTQQARLLAAALGERGVLDAEAAERILVQMNQRWTARLKVISADGQILADSSRLGPRRGTEGGDREAAPEPALVRESWLYRVGAAPFRLLREWRTGTAESYDREPTPSAGLDPEVEAALAGRYGAAVRPASGGERALTLSIAVPVRSEEGVVGAVTAAQSTLRVLAALDEVRVSLFRVFLVSLAVAVALSLLLAATISRPLSRLRHEAAELLDRRGRLKGTFRGSSQLDEIGDLSRALETLSRRIEGHVRFVEAFAADVSHEFKNPLAAIRGATEMLSEVEDPAERRHFHGIVTREVARMEQLLSAVREITRIDSQLEREPVGPVDLGHLLEELVAGTRHRTSGPVELELRRPEEGLVVSASPERLAQVFENLFDNAISFAATRVEVEVEVEKDGARARVTVTDDGPGIPRDHRERVFDRFFSYRPADPEARRHHTGLGLAIVRTIVEAYGGEVRAEDGPSGGARLTVELPLGGT